MEVTNIKVKCVKLSFDHKVHPLHITIPDSIFETLSQSDDCSQIVCCLHWKDVHTSELFVVAHPASFVKGNIIGVTSYFLQHYGLNDGQYVYLKSVLTLPLEKVVFGVKNRETYQILKNLLKERNFLFDLHKNKNICRQGDICLLSVITFLGINNNDIITLECLPFHQGHISHKTSIILAEIFDPVTKPELQNERNNINSSFPDPVACWNILNYSSQIVLSYVLNHPIEKWLFNEHFNSFNAQYHDLNKQLSSPYLSVNVLPNCPFKCEIVPNIIDKNSVVFVAESILKQFGLSHGCCIEIEISSKNTNPFSRKSSLCNAELPPAYTYESSGAEGLNLRSRHSSNTSTSKLKISSTPITKSENNSSPPAQPQTLSRHHSGNSIKKMHDEVNSNKRKISKHRNRSDSNISNITFDDILASMISTSPKISQRTRIAQVFSLCEKNYQFVDLSLFHKTNTFQAFLSPLLWFNLNTQPAEFVQPETKIYIRKCCSKTSKAVEEPTFAKELHVSLVNSPFYQFSVPCDALLKHYFSTPRIIHKGDIFAVYSADDPMFSQNYAGSIDNISTAVIFFKAAYFKGEPDSNVYLVDAEHTSVYQAGSTQSYVPNVMETYLSGLPLHPLWDSPFPCGLEHYVTQLKDIILPFLRDCKSKDHKMPTTVLISGDSGVGKRIVVQAVSKLLNIPVNVINSYELNGDSSGATESRINSALTVFPSPSIILLRKLEAVGRNKDEMGFDSRVVSNFLQRISDFSTVPFEFPTILIGTGFLSSLHPSICNAFIHNLKIKGPTEMERLSMLDGLFSDVSLAANTSLESIAERTPGFLLCDLCHLYSEAKKCCYRRISKNYFLGEMTSQQEENLCLAGVSTMQEDLEHALEVLQTANANSVGAPKIPDVKWNDVGGLDEVKSEILDTIQLPLENPSLISCGLQRSGLLLYGPPGTGKTMLAKAVAHECSLNFLSVKGPELINMYVGQSEENIRKIFNQARNAKPCVIFFDELDSLAPKRGKSGDSGGVMDRVVSQLLAEMDGVNKSLEVFVIGATNRPDLLDPALLRPGRFDRLLYVGISKDKGDQLKILKALTKEFPMSTDIDLEKFVMNCPQNLSGADFYALCSDAMLNSITRNIENKDLNLNPEEEILEVKLQDFECALRDLVPSVPLEELQKYDKLHSSLS